MYIDESMFVPDFEDTAPSKLLRGIIYRGISEIYEKQQDDRIKDEGEINYFGSEGELHISGLSSSGDCPLKLFHNRAKKLYDDSDSMLFGMESAKEQKTLANLSILLEGYQFEEVIEKSIEDFLTVDEEILESSIDLTDEFIFRRMIRSSVSHIHSRNRKVCLKINSDKNHDIVGHIDGLIDLPQGTFLIECKAMGVDPQIWKDIINNPLENLIEYCLTSDQKTAEIYRIKYRLFLYICQTYAYRKALIQEGLDIKGSIFIIKNTYNRSIACLDIPFDKRVEQFYIDRWQLVLDCLVKNEPPEKPACYKLKSAVPCLYCPFKDSCYE